MPLNSGAIAIFAANWRENATGRHVLTKIESHEFNSLARILPKSKNWAAAFGFQPQSCHPALAICVHPSQLAVKQVRERTPTHTAG
jgi:hypothetical protein